MGEPKPLTFGKLTMAVCLGILLAGVVSGVGYYLVVVAPAERAQASADWRALQAEQQLQNDILQAENVALDRQIKEADPKSPCNVLTGDDFTKCSKLVTWKEKREFADKFAPMPHRRRIGAADGSKTASESVLQQSPEPLRDISKLPLCDDVKKIPPPPGKSYPTCRF